MNREWHAKDGKRGAVIRLGLLCAVLPLLQACGGDGDDGVPAPAVRPYVPVEQPRPVPIAPPPDRQTWQMPPVNQQRGNGWSSWTQPPPQPAPAAGDMYPQARNPWQGPPMGFGRDVAQGQQVWPQHQAAPTPPTFRPWQEEQAEHHKQHQAAMPVPQLVAPYDRPLGSSRRGGQQIYVPPSVGYQYAPGYGGLAPGYGTYSPYGWGYGPINNGPFGMGMFPFW